MTRVESAKSLKRLGGALLRYGDLVDKACAERNPRRELSAFKALARAQERMREFTATRDAWRGDA